MGAGKSSLERGRDPDGGRAGVSRRAKATGAKEFSETNLIIRLDPKLLC